MDQVPESRQPGGRNAIAYTDSPMYLGAGSRGGLLRRRCSRATPTVFALPLRAWYLQPHLLHQGHTTQVCVSLTLLHNSRTSVPPPTHTHTHTQTVFVFLYASFIPRPQQFSIARGETGNKVDTSFVPRSLGTRLDAPGYEARCSWVRG